MVIWVNRKSKKSNQVWSAGTKPKREECLLSTQLISQGNPTVKINGFEGNGPKWLVPKGILLLSDREQDFERERGNQPIDACLPISFSICFFLSLILLLSFSFFPSHSFFYFLVFFLRDSCY